MFISCPLLIIFLFSSPATPIDSNINIIRSSVFDLDRIKATIHDTQKKCSDGHTLEADFTRIMFLLLPFFLTYNPNFVFIPEVWVEHQNNGLKRCDGLAYVVRTQAGVGYGTQDNKIVYEGKNRFAISWRALLSDQLWSQADSFRQNGKIWVIASIGFEMCVFTYDVLKYTDRGEDYRNFNPVRPNSCITWTPKDFEWIDAEVITAPNNPNLITVIKWKLNDPAHHPFIHDILHHISTNNP